MGTYFGWSCMSCRHPARVSMSSMTPDWRCCLMRHLLHALHALELQQEVGGLVALELRIAGFDDEEEMVAAGHGEASDVEDGVIGHGQSVEREHAEDGRACRRQHRALERDGNKGWPTEQRAPANIERVVDRGHPVLHGHAADASDDAADEHDERQPGVMEPDGLAQLFDGEGRVGVHLAIAGFVRLARRLHDVRGRGELGDDSVDGVALRRSHSSTSACGRMVRISKMEMTGRKRTNRKSSARNNPMVPTKVMMSQRVGWNMPQDEGRKSRGRLMAMMTKRSSHMPMFTMMATRHEPSGLLRTPRIHSSCGGATLQVVSDQ